jgi:hypothetical protein
MFSLLKKFIKSVLFTLLILCFLENASAQQDTRYHSCSFSFKLNQAANTSAGVFNTDGVLVKTLWSGVHYEAGSHQAIWDGTNDDGNLLPAARYQVRVLTNNVKYTWEGVIGNTSEKSAGPTIFRAHDYMRGIAIAGNTAYYTIGYNEQGSSTLKFNTQKPFGKLTIPVTGIQSNIVATDGKLVYWVAFEIKTNTNFIYATNTSNDALVNFTNGTTTGIVRSKLKISTLERTTTTDKISGLAVQKSGRFLISAHVNTNQVHVMDKVTGAAISSATVTSPQSIVAVGNNDVWISCLTNGKPAVLRYELSANGILRSTGTSLPGLLKPLAMAVSPDGRTLLVADGGGSQQLKAFDSQSANLKWTFGQEGGYAVSADVSDDKFYFSNVRKELGTCLAFETDGSFWVEDSGNSRLQHYSAARVFLNRIMYLPTSYSMAVNRTNASRVFSDYLEFKVDYAKPLQPGNGSWTLVKNWGALVPDDLDRKYNRLKDIITLSNGRTYAFLGSKKKHNRQLVELTAQGVMRFANVFIPMNYSMDNNGNLYRISNFKLGMPNTWYCRKLSGFDPANNPVWGGEVVVASTPPATFNDPLNEGNGASLYAGEITSSNVILAFNPKPSPSGSSRPHLGGVKLGGSQWLWQTAVGTQKGYRGDFPANGAFDNGNSVRNAGSMAVTIDRNIFWGYYGEFWKASETNKWNQVYDDGLFIGQFGIIGSQVNGMEGGAMMAGNAMSASVVKDNNGNVYLYHNDEATHSGVHRWKVSNLASIAEQAIAVELIFSKQGLTTEYFKGDDLNNVNVIYTDVIPANTFNNVALPGQLKSVAGPVSVRMSGFLKPENTAIYSFQNAAKIPLRLWLNNTLIIDEWNSKSGGPGKLIELNRNLAYAIKVEFLNTSNVNGPLLAWSEGNGQPKPLAGVQLFPAEYTNLKNSFNLLDGLTFDSILEDGKYGWYRDKPTDDNTNKYNKWWSVRTSLRKFDRLATPDLSVSFRQANTVNTITRNLGSHNPVKQWQISGIVNFSGNYPNQDKDLSENGSGGSFLEVLDDAGKVLTRLFFSVDINTKEAMMYANRKSIFKTTQDNLWAVMATSNELTIKMENGNASVKYGPYPAVSVPAFNPSAKWARPKTFRLYFWSKKQNSNRAIDIEQLNFSFK